jgi:hypothetical protein
VRGKPKISQTVTRDTSQPAPDPTVTPNLQPWAPSFSDPWDLSRKIPQTAQRGQTPLSALPR